MATVQNDIMAGGSVKNIVDRFSRDFSSAKPSLNSNEVRKPVGPKPVVHPLVVVTFQYSSAQADELNLVVGDTIEILEEVEEGWAKGRIQRTGEVGVFPTNFVESKGSPVTAPSMSTSMTTKEDTAVVKRVVSDDKPEAIKRTPSVVLPNSSIPLLSMSKEEVKDEKTKEMARIKFVYEPHHADELHLDEIGSLIEILRKDCGDAGWFEGELNGKKGLFPDNFVELVQMPVSCKSGNPKVSHVAKSDKPMKAPLVPPSDISVAPPAVPAKPTKPKFTESAPPMNSSTSAPPAPSSSTKPVSSNFAKNRSRVAQGLKVVAPGDAVPSVLSKSTIVPGSYSEPSGPTSTRPLSTIEPRYEESDEATQLNHVTKDRPRPPGKRPMSALVQNKRQSNDNVLESPTASSDGFVLVSSLTNQFPTSTVEASSTSSPVKTSVAMKPFLKEEVKKEELSASTSMKSNTSFPVKEKPFLSNTTETPSFKSAVGGSAGDYDYVSRREYNELLNKVAALECKIANLENANR